MARRSELVDVLQRYYQILVGSSTLVTIVGKNEKHRIYNIYKNQAIPGYTYPFVLFKVTGNDRFSATKYRLGVGKHKICLRGWVDVLFYNDTNDFTESATVAELFENLFGQDQMTLDDVFIGISVEAPINYTTFNEGKHVEVVGVRTHFQAYATN